MMSTEQCQWHCHHCWAAAFCLQWQISVLFLWDWTSGWMTQTKTNHAKIIFLSITDGHMQVHRVHSLPDQDQVGFAIWMRVFVVDDDGWQLLKFGRRALLFSLQSHASAKVQRPHQGSCLWTDVKCDWNGLMFKFRFVCVKILFRRFLSKCGSWNIAFSDASSKK